MATAVAEDEAYEQWLASPAAAEEREASRIAYGDETRSEAEALLGEKFEEAIAGLEGDPARALSNLQIEDVLGTHAARIADQDASGGSELVESTAPIEDRVLSGASEPVDLSLRSVGEEFVAENPLADVRLPDSADGIVELMGDVAITDLPGDGESLASRFGDKDLFYPETDVDTDTLIAPVSGGVEIFSQLRSPESPEDFRFELQLPKGSALLGEGEEARVQAADGTAIRIPAPKAIDAQDTVIPVEMAVEGDSLLIHVPHREIEIAYPVLLDPPFLDENFPWSWGYWKPAQVGGDAAYGLSINGGNIHVNSVGGEQLHRAGSRGYWYFQPPGETSYVSGVSFGSFGWETPGTHSSCWTPQPHAYWGIADTSGGWPFLSTIQGDRNAWGPGGHSGWVGHPGSRWAIVGIETTIDKRSKCARNLDMAGATVTMDDDYAPWIGAPSGPGKPVGSVPAPITVSASDSGLGLSRIRTEYPGGSSDVFPSGPSECGWYSVPCVGSWTNQINYNPAVMPEGNVTLTVKAYDAVENWSTTTTTITVDHTPPGTIIDSGPASDSAIVGPTATFKFHASELSSTFQCKLDSAAFASCSGGGYTTPVLSAGNHELQIRATDPAGNTNNSPTRRSFYVGPPDTTIDFGPSGLTNDETPGFEYHASQAGTNFECRIDSGAFSACGAGGFVSPALGNGAHTFQVRAVNSGLTDPTPASTSFTVDTIPPTFDIVGGPTGPTNQTTPTFAFTKEAGATVTCSIDTGAASFDSCTGATTHQSAGALGQQTYFFRIRETDAAGNESPPAKRTFTVDTVAPQTTIESGPKGVTANAFPRFDLDSSETEAGFECRVDSDDNEACGSEFVVEELDDGQHSVYASAEDEAGNVDASPATRTFAVDTTAPGAAIENGPSGLTADNTPTFVFSAGAGATVKCAIEADADDFDPSEYRACSTATSDTSASALADGGYTFHLQVSDALENQHTLDRHFTVDTAPPDTSIISGPEGATDDPQPTFGFSASEARVKYECQLDGSSFASCSGPGPTHSPATTLADGEHIFSVRAVDKAGAADLTPATRTFTVDTKKPQTTIESGPDGPTLDTTPKFGYAASEPGGFQCKVDSASFSSCPSATVELGALADGRHTLAVRALDAASNPDPTPAQRTFVLDTGAPTTPSATGQLRDPETPGVTLRVEVSDGDSGLPTTLRSGVKKIDVSIDGVPVYQDEMPCVGAHKTCPNRLSREMELPYQNVLGTHVYRVETADALGHKATTVEWTEYTPNDGTVITYMSAGNGCGTLSGPNQNVVENLKEGTIHGGPGADLIVANPNFPTIYGGPGCDVIIGSFAKEAIHGGAGHDLIRGNRSSDEIFGEAGDDQIFGGIGDDTLRGADGNDYLDGGPGADAEWGETNNDTVRGGQGIDKLVGQGGNDTVSFADAVGPGFPRGGIKEHNAATAIPEALAGVAGFPGTAKTGVFVNLNGPPGDGGKRRDYASNGGGSNGGGMDYLYIPQNEHPALPGAAHASVSGDFENVVGSAFGDVIRGSGGVEEIWGGPGPDIVRGGGGADRIDGGTNGDFLDGGGTAAKLTGGDSETDRCVGRGAGTTVVACGSTEDKVVPRAPNKLAIGIQAPESEANGGLSVEEQHANLFVDGSTSDDFVSADYSPNKVVFTVRTAAELAASFCTKAGGSGSYTVTCNLDQRQVGSVMMLGGEGNDTLNDGELDRRTSGSVVILGGPGTDLLKGTATDEMILDGQQQGSGEEKLSGGGGDDVLIQGDGRDRAEGDNGHDLLMSSEICNGDTLDGDAGSDNAQFAKLEGSGVFADLAAGHLGDTAKGNNTCTGGGGGFDPLREIDDVEGSPQNDVIEGNGKDNLLIGRGGADVLRGMGGGDTLNSKDGDQDPVVHCGDQKGDRAHIDMSLDDRKAAENHCEKVDADGVTYYLRDDLMERLVAETDGTWSGFQAAASSASTAPLRASAYPLDDESGVVADNVVEEGEDGQYRKADVGPAGDGEGPDLGVAGSMLGNDQAVAVALDGVNDYIELGESTELDPEVEASPIEGHSVELWVKFDDSPVEKEYLYSGMEEGEGPFLFRAADGNVVFGAKTEAGTPEVQTAEPINDGQWHHVVGTLEGEEVALYVDGFPHRLNYGQPVVTEASQPEDEVVGASGGLDHFVDGTVDEVVVYEGALPQDEVIFHLATSEAEGPETLLAPEPDPLDSDGDSVPDSEDNCSEASNPDQEDADLDGVGDACLVPDSDGDGAGDADDNCPTFHNADQADRDGDGLGAECDPSELRVSTQEATDVGATTATLNALVNPEGVATGYQFEYGTTISYGRKSPSPSSSLTAGIDDEPVKHSVGALEPGSTYHYRVVATAEGATTYGDDHTFKTQAAPDVASRLGALSVTEPFDGSAPSLANFSSNWSQLGWAGGSTPKGSNTTTGWRPVDAFSA
ncbi:MAG TPA: Ig-like domain-containing protein, partial [Solirubrobacterales bacterium]|nr:Ig-like domain-containing protein [Solirubrobacterales bacterium]